MNARVLSINSNNTLTIAMLLLPGITIAATAIGNIGPAYGFIYGITMALIGQQLAVSGRLSAKNLTHFFGIALLVPGIALAATTGGVFGLAYGIGRGSALPAVLGIILAIFGMLGPTIVNALFSSATI